MAEFVPMEIVQKLSAAGKSEQEIITQLRLQGFTPSQIDKAMKEALKAHVTGPQPLGLSPEMPEEAAPLPEKTKTPNRPEVSAGPRALPIPRHPTRENPIQQIPQQPIPGPMGEPPEKIRMPTEIKPVEMPSGAMPKPVEIRRPTTEISIEELIEAVVNERWIKFEEQLSLYDKRDTNLQQQIQEIKKQIEELREQKKREEQTFVEKLDQFGESVEKTQTRIGSIESAFKEFVPTLAENVRELSTVIEKMKKAK